MRKLNVKRLLIVLGIICGVGVWILIGRLLSSNTWIHSSGDKVPYCVSYGFISIVFIGVVIIVGCEIYKLVGWLFSK
jgi:hypothetical protein